MSVGWDMEGFTVCTFNVNSIKVRKDLVTEWLERRGKDVDVLCLQELKGTEETFPYDLATGPLKDKMKQVAVDLWPRRRRAPKPSDHPPVLATLLV